MRLIEKVWDFVYGVILIGGTPQVVFMTLGLLTGFVLPSPPEPGQKLTTGVVIWGCLIAIIPVAASIGTLLYVIRVRATRRLLPGSFCAAEIAVGCVLGSLYFIVAMAATAIEGLLN